MRSTVHGGWGGDVPSLACRSRAGTFIVQHILTTSSVPGPGLGSRAAVLRVVSQTLTH